MRKYLLYILFIFVVNEGLCQRNYHNLVSTITIKGTSNLHNWTIIEKEAKVDMVMTVDSDRLKVIQFLSAEMPVRAIKCSEGVLMDNNIFKALKADSFPLITYHLEKVKSLVQRGDHYVIAASGVLNIAGVVNKIDLLVRARIGEDKSINFSFSKKIKMTDYCIKPPTTLFGLINTGNEIELVFNFIVNE